MTRPLARLFLLIATVIAVLALAVGAAPAADCPDWCIRGICAVETSSILRADGSVRYVNQRRGRDGEVGICQAMPATLRAHGFSPSLYEQDTAYALAATRAILAKYYATTGNWWHAVAMWRQRTAYQSPTAQSYARRVSDAAGEK